jgi:pimeloyl-ACP methyl ester carboxylesterase
LISLSSAKEPLLCVEYLILMKRFSVPVLLIIAGLVSFYWLRNPEKNDMTESVRSEAQGSFVSLSDGITHYELTGPDTAETIVLVHGFSVPYYIWDSTVNALTSIGYRVLRYDLFGRGYSDRPGVEYNENFYDRQLLELLTSLNIAPPVHLAGLSFGGPVSSYFTKNHPQWVKSLILLDPVTKPFEKQALPEAVSLVYLKLFLASSIPQSQYTDFYDPAPFSGWAERYKAQMRYRGFLHALNSTRYHYVINPPDVLRSVAELNKPVLLIWGQEDTTTPFSESEKVVDILNPEFLPVKDAGHLPHMEKAGLVNEKLVQFIRSAGK